MEITITHPDGDTQTIITTEDVEDAESVLELHGVDPSDVEMSVKKSTRGRIKDLEQAAGVGGKGKNGIAHRIDDLEQRISNLEDGQ